MIRIALALLLLTTPAMAQVAAGTAPVVGGAGNSPAPDVSNDNSSEAPSRRAATSKAGKPRVAKRPMRSGATGR